MFGFFATLVLFLLLAIGVELFRVCALRILRIDTDPDSFLPVALSCLVLYTAARFRMTGGLSASPLILITASVFFVGSLITWRPSPTRTRDRLDPRVVTFITLVYVLIGCWLVHAHVREGALSIGVLLSILAVSLNASAARQFLGRSRGITESCV